ncbi:MAG: glycosyltransferase family 4 protein [Patescibacteria group bacterium]|jgi:glycosyltransferase involved in cell wall biosynthesis
MKKIGIFDPYLDTIGGGERYCLSIAEVMLKKGWQVDVFWKDSSIKDKLEEKLGLDLENLNFVDYCPNQNSLLQRRKFERVYDVLFYVSDGSIPFMFGKKNFLHFQVPFKHVLKKTLLNQLKLKTINALVCNSLFTKKVINSCLGTESLVVYPPVDIIPIKPLKKENIIISVGRFSQLLQGKRQDVLVDAFKSLVDKHSLKSWKLILAGGSEVGGREFVEELKKNAAQYPIKIIENPPFAELLKLYGKAKIFWQASGFGVDEKLEPEKVEHFGMATVESMAAGCVPVVLGSGGQREIVERNKNGLLWQTQEELVALTLELIKSKSVMTKLSENAMLRCGQFSKEKFTKEIYNLFENERKK